MKTLLLFICLAIYSTAIVAQQESVQEKFERAYRIYQDTLAYPNSSEHSLAAYRAYLHGSKLFPDTIQLANLALNFGSVPNSGRYEQQEDALEVASNIIEKIHGKNSMEMVDVLFAESQLKASLRQGNGLNSKLKKAIRIVEDNVDDKLLLADLNLEAGEILLQAGQSSSVNFFKDAIEIYSTLDNQDAKEGVVRAYMELGNAYLAKNQKQRSEEALLAGLAIAKESQTDILVQQAIHAFLVELYDRWSKPEKMTYHSHEVGRFLSDQGRTVEQFKPLISSRPVYPENALERRLEGWARLEFTVTTQGLVEDAKVINYEGHNDFGIAALEAIKEFKFAPAFRDGEPVDTPNVEYVFNFVLVH